MNYSTGNDDEAEAAQRVFPAPLADSPIGNAMSKPAPPVVSGSVSQHGEAENAAIDASSVRSSKSRSASVTSQSSHGSRHDDEGISIVTQSVASFVNNALQQPRYSTPLAGPDLSTLFQSFYKELEQTLYPTDDSNVRLLSPDEMAARNRRKRYLKRLMDGAEQQLAGILYTKLFDPAIGSDRAIDSRLQARIATVSAHPSLSEELHNEIPLEVRGKLSHALEIFSRIDRDRTPLAKLDVLVQTHREIVAALDASDVSADALLPAFLYVLCESNVPHLWLNTVYMRRFRRASALEGEYNYCLTNLEAAVHLLNTWVFTELPEGIDMTPFGEMPVQDAGGRWRGALWNSSLGSTLTTGYSALLSRFQRENESPREERDSPSPRKKPAVHSKFLNLDADQLTIGEVRELLHEYRRLAAYIHR